METKEKKSNKLIIIVVGAIVLLGSIAANVMFFKKSNHYKGENEMALMKIDSLNASIGESKKEFESLTKEKDHYLFENKKLNSSIENLKNEINLKENSSSNSKAAGISGLTEKIKKLEKENEAKITNYTQENNKLRIEIESLKKNNSKLSDELAAIKKHLEIAKDLKVTGIDIECFKVNSKNKAKATEKAKKVNRISVSFDIFENPIADKGKKNIYVLVYDSKGVLLDNKEGQFLNKKTAKNQSYSGKTELDYKNAESRETVSFDYHQKLTKGKFKVEIYIDGTLGGKRELTLK